MKFRHLSRYLAAYFLNNLTTIFIRKLLQNLTFQKFVTVCMEKNIDYVSK